MPKSKSAPASKTKIKAKQSVRNTSAPAQQKQKPGPSTANTAAPAQKGATANKSAPTAPAPNKANNPAEVAPAKSLAAVAPAKSLAAAPQQSRVTTKTQAQNAAARVRSTVQTGSVSTRTVRAAPSSWNVDAVGTPIDWDNDFRIMFKTLANNIYPAEKYVSQATGLEILHVEVPGPVVNAYLVLGTYPLDDDGLPHCLEHLVFLGSKEYLYKGILDGIATKCMSSGTNAWTDSDHTCYTYETAGQDGFCCLLPIFLEHIFFPTLTEYAFLTEVHHITREGKDGGVVYSEMMAKQHSPENRTILELSQELYPKTSPYHYNSGGILKNLRTTCNNERVAAFHKQYYTPRNLRVIVCGVLDMKRLFKCLIPVMRKLVAQKYPPFRHPVVDRAPPVAAKTIPISYAAEGDDDEETVITIAFLGPSMLTELEAVTGVRLLIEYFCDSAASPLEQEFVEGEDAICSSVEGGHYDNAQPFFFFEFVGADEEDTTKIQTRLRQVLKAEIQDFDMIRMAGIVLKASQEDISAMENTPRDICAYAGILDFLYGQNNKEQFEAFMSLSQYKLRFLHYKSQAWTALIKKHFLDLNWVTAVAKPSKNEQIRLAKREATRIEQRKMKMGDVGLAMLHEELEAALAFNARPIPPEFLRNIAPKKETSISTHKIKRYKNPDFIGDVGCNIFVDDIDSNFVYVTIHMDTTPLPPELRKYLSILREAFTESPMKMDNGQIIPFLAVVQGLTRDLINHSFSYGLSGGTPFSCGSFQHLFCCKAQIEMGAVDRGFDWIYKLLYNTMWDTVRFQIIIEKLLAEITRLKRDGVALIRALMNDILYKDDSNMKCTSFIRQEAFLKDLSDAITDHEKAEDVAEALDQIRAILTEPKNMTLHIATSLDKLRPVLKSRAVDFNYLISKIFPKHNRLGNKKLPNAFDFTWMHSVEELNARVSANSSKCLGHRVCIGLNAITSGFVMLGCCTGINDYKHPDLSALNTAMKYFCQEEGPLLKAVRGGGYAYNVWMEAIASEGTLKLIIYQSSNTVEAFEAVKNVVEQHLTEKNWNEDLCVSAKSGLGFHLTAMERTPLKMSAMSLQSYYRKTEEGHAQREIAKIQSLTLADLQAVTKKYFAKLFDKNNLSVVVCPTNRVTTVVKKFKKLGYEMQVLEKLAHCPMAGWNI